MRLVLDTDAIVQMLQHKFDQYQLEKDSADERLHASQDSVRLALAPQVESGILKQDDVDALVATIADNEMKEFNARYTDIIPYIVEMEEPNEELFENDEEFLEDGIPVPEPEV